MTIAHTARLTLLAAAAVLSRSALGSAQQDIPEAAVAVVVPGALLVAVAALAVTLAVVALRSLANRQPDHGVPSRHGGGVSARTRAPVRPAPAAGDDADADGIEVREHLDAEELALALTHFGPRGVGSPGDGAFAAAHPREALDPWFKLLGLYRQSGARDEFETLARRLNTNFNVRVPGWEESATGHRLDAGSLEAYPHVIERLERIWHREACRDYLGTLLVDTRGGMRAGFSKGAVEDILLLVGIQELRARATLAKRRPSRRARKTQPRAAA